MMCRWPRTFRKKPAQLKSRCIPDNRIEG
jgi:hypothetical protein